MNRRGEPRVRFNSAVRLRYRLFQEFLRENAANISPGGMFIRTIHPGDVGSELDFEVRLEDDFTLIEGHAEVVWVRRESAGPDAPPGMGIRFLELASDSRALVDRIVGDRMASGLELFDLENEAPTASEATAASEAASSSEPAAARPAVETPSGAAADLAALDQELPPPAAAAAGAAAEPIVAGTAAGGVAARSRMRPLRLIGVVMISALIGAGAMLLFNWLYVQPSIDHLETRIDELAGSPGGPWRPLQEEPAAAPAAAVGDEAQASATTSAAGQSAEVLDALRGWAAAWSEQRTDDYLACYAAAFEPPDGLDRPAWEASRRARIERPQWIRVALTLVQVETTGAESAEASFVQSYRSERYKDLVRKRMSMVREDGAWKIAAERSSP